MVFSFDVPPLLHSVALLRPSGPFVMVKQVISWILLEYGLLLIFLTTCRLKAKVLNKP